MLGTSDSGSDRLPAALSFEGSIIARRFVEIASRALLDSIGILSRNVASNVATYESGFSNTYAGGINSVRRMRCAMMRAVTIDKGTATLRLLKRVKMGCREERRGL